MSVTRAVQIAKSASLVRSNNTGKIIVRNVVESPSLLKPVLERKYDITINALFQNLLTRVEENRCPPSSRMSLNSSSS